jgi:hypothetical protein
LAKNNFAARDNERPSAHFLTVASLEQRVIRSTERMKEQDRPTSLVASHLVVAKALYSAGAPAADCLVHVGSAADALLTRLKWSVQSPLKGIPNIGIYIEGLSASRLVGSHREVVNAYRAAKFVVIHSWQRSLLDSLAAALVPGSDAPAKAAPTDAPVEYSKRFVALINTVRDADKGRFNGQLEDYLLKEWGPVAERRARIDLDSKRTVYSGKWTFFGVAACRAISHVPDLSPKALLYCPGELLTDRVGSSSDSGSAPKATTAAKNADSASGTAKRATKKR